MTLSIADGHSHTAVGDTAYAVGLGIVFGSHHLATLFADILGVDAQIVAGREAIVNPQEAAYLLALEGPLHHLDAIGTKADNLTGTQVAHHLIVEVGHAGCLGRNAVGTLLLSDDDAGASQCVAGSNDAVFGEYQHRARTLYLLVNQVDAVGERIAHIDEQGDKLRLIDVVGTHLAEVHTLSQQLVGYLAHVVHLRHRHHGIAPQVRIDEDGLRIGVADDADARLSHKSVELALEARAEIVAFQTVNASAEALLCVERHHTRTLRTEMRVVVGAVEQVVDTLFY